MDLWGLTLIAIIVNAVIGATVCACLDTEDQHFLKWVEREPTGGFATFLVIQLWPIMAFLMIKYKLQQDEDNGTR